MCQADHMNSGFDPDTFRLRREGCPEWATSTRTLGSGMNSAELNQLEQQMPALLRQVEVTVQWAMFEPENAQTSLISGPEGFIGGMRTKRVGW